MLIITAVNTKKYIVIDLKKTKGVDHVHELDKVFDVPIESFTPGLMKRFGLYYETLKKINPHLVYVYIAVYYQNGPYHGRTDYDIVLSAGGGLMYITAESNGNLCKLVGMQRKIC
ncbi:MAG: CoA transferase [Candidatus Zixiibacteriota bacterium]